MLAELQNYQWSSYGSYTGKGKKIPWLTVETILGGLGHSEMKQNQKRPKQPSSQGSSSKEDFSKLELR